jgi:hypothetical protein
MEPTKNESNMNQISETEDPVLLMLGLGRHLWKQESGEKFNERMRSEDLTAPPFRSRPQE